MYSPRGIEDYGLNGPWGRWLAVAVYLALIFALSSMPDLAPPVDVGNADKAAHFLEYAGLGFLLARAWRGSRLGRDLPRVLLFTVLAGGAVAVLDETYQGSVTGRERSSADAAADLAGILAGGSTLLLSVRRSRGESVKPGRKEPMPRSGT
jgi:VanZ family protein